MKTPYFHKTLFAGLMLLSTARPAAAIENYFAPTNCTSEENKVINCFVDAAKEMGAAVELVGVKDLAPARAPFTKPDKSAHRHVYILMSDGETFAAAYLKPRNRNLSVAVGSYSRDMEDFLKPYTILNADINIPRQFLSKLKVIEKEGGEPASNQEAAKERANIAKRIAAGLAKCAN